MNWAAPAYAWLLLLGIPAVFLLRRARAWRRHAMSRLAGEDQAPPARIPPAQFIHLLAGLLILAALCRPQWGQVASQQQGRGLDILIALDVSRSMLADDLRPTRLAAAKAAVAGLLPRLRGDRIGLIAFAGSAYLVCPLTSDYAAFAAVLDAAGSDTLPLGGTALDSALGEARRAFAALPGHGKALIVISDGEDHGSGAAATARALREAGVTIYGVAAGTPAGGLIPLPGGEFLKDRQGAVVRSRSQTAPLQDLAGGRLSVPHGRPKELTSPSGGNERSESGGRFISSLAADPKALETLYGTELAALEKKEIRGTRLQLAERFQLPLALALALLLGEPLLGGRRKP